jgi:hypothetical protein
VTTTQETNWDTHLSSNGTDHSYIDQDVTTTGTPQFASIGVGTPASATSIIYALDTFDATNVLGINGNITNTYKDAVPLVYTTGLSFSGIYKPALTGNKVLAGGGAYGANVLAHAYNDTTHDLTVVELIGIKSRAQITQSVGGGTTTATNSYAYYALPNARTPTTSEMTNSYAYYDEGQTVGTNNWGIAINTANNYINGSLRIGSAAAPSERLTLDLATEDLDIVDAGSVDATEQDWIEVNVGGNQGYIRVFTTK